MGRQIDPPLQARASYSSTRSYVLKLHRDAEPGLGRFKGRLEHVASGDVVEFDGVARLLQWLAAHDARIRRAE